MEQKTPNPQGSGQIAPDAIGQPIGPLQPPEIHKQDTAPPAAKLTPPQMKEDLRQLFIIAKRQYEERDLDGLETTLRKIIERDPEAGRAYHMLGLVYLERKDEESALRIFSEAVTLFPRDPMLHHDLGTLYFKKGFHELARQELSKALEISPNFPKAEQTRKLLMALGKGGPLQPLVEAPPPSPPVQPNLENPGEVMEQKLDDPSTQANPDPPTEGEPQNPNEPPHPEASSE
jgi:tetratricopeptide (TPR) repeat protein